MCESILINYTIQKERPAMRFEELIKTYYDYTELSIPYSEDKFKLIDLLEDRFEETDKDFFAECKQLIMNACAETQYNAFIAGFKHGLECELPINKK